jgi:hypothetical protein
VAFEYWDDNHERYAYERPVASALLLGKSIVMGGMVAAAPGR